MYKINKNAFTLVELIVVITILSILWTIWFLSVQNFALNARDSVRNVDIKTIKKALAHNYIHSWNYPTPTNQVDITIDWYTTWIQWVIWPSVRQALNTIDKVPVDPLYWHQYSYSITPNRREYEIWWVLESPLTTTYLVPNTYAAENHTAIISWTYNWLLITAKSWTWNFIVTSPSIISIQTSNPDFLTIVWSNQLAFNGTNRLPEMFQSLDTQSENLINIWNPIVYTWSTKSLEIPSNQVILAKNTQDAYQGIAYVQNIKLIKDLLDSEINLNNPSQKAYNLWCTFVTLNLKYKDDCIYHLTTDPTSTWSTSTGSTNTWSTSTGSTSTWPTTPTITFNIWDIPTPINEIFVDSNNDLWFGSNSWVAFFTEAGLVYYTKTNSDLIHNKVLSISEWIDWSMSFWWNLWVSVLASDWTWSTITDSNSPLLHKHTLFIYTADSWEYWFATNKGINSYDWTNWEEYTKKDQWLSHNHASTILQDSNWNMWFGTTSGLDQYEVWVWIVQTFTPWNTSGWLGSNKYSDILEDESYNFWIATDSWLSYYNSTTWIWNLYTSSNTSWSLVWNDINDLFFDTDWNLWISTTSWLSFYNTSTSSWGTPYTTSNWLSWNIVYVTYEKWWYIYVVNSWWIDILEK